MEYLHHNSIPATKSELELFSVPATQTAIESYYDVEYRPTSTLDSSQTFDFNIPASDDYTDLSEMMVHVIGKVTKDGKDLVDADLAHPGHGFGNALFQQVQFYLNGVNTAPSNNLYQYQAFIEDFMFKHKSELDHGSLMVEDTGTLKSFGKKEFDMFFPLHVSLAQQNTLLVSGVPILVRLSRNPGYFGLLSASKDHEFKIMGISLHIRRVKLFPDVQLAIEKGLDKSPANYFITRNEVKSFVITSGASIANFESIFNGIIPKRIFVGFVKQADFESKGSSSPFYFDDQKINYIVTYANGVQVPSIAYTPDFSTSKYMREFVSLFRYSNQHETHPQVQASYKKFATGHTLFAFDYSPDNSIGAESGTLSLVKRGNIRMEVRFSAATTQNIYMIVFAQYDSIISIDKYRNVSVDY